MRVRTYVVTAAAALAFSFSVLAQQPPAGPPQAPAAPPLGPPAPFYPHVVATGLRGGYQVVAADMNKDGKVDLIGLGSQNPELIWYENPYWTPHVITREAPRMVNLAAADVDRDGIPELALAYEFSTNRQNSGKIGILKAGKDPREPWTLTQIDELAMTSHRVRFLTIGNQTLLVSAPIITAESTDGFANSNRTVTPLHAYRPPDWKRETISEESKGVVHGLLISDWDGDGRDDVITAGYMGVFVHSLGKDGKWTRSLITAGNAEEWPRSGTSDVVVGRLNGKKFLAANEPFHGNQVVVYTDAGGAWTRTTHRRHHQQLALSGAGRQRRGRHVGDRLGRHAGRARHGAWRQARRLFLQGRCRRAEVGAHGARRGDCRQRLRRRRPQRRPQDGPGVHRRRRPVVADVVRKHEEVAGGRLAGGSVKFGSHRSFRHRV